MKNIQNLTIDINKKPFQSLTANVGEVASRFIRITILENNIPADLTGVTAYLYAKKADGTKVFNSVKVEDAKKGIVLAELTSQTLAVAGLVKLTLLLTKDGTKLASKQIMVTVDESNIDEEAIQSRNEFNALADALKKVNNIDNKMDKGDKILVSQIDKNNGKIDQTYLTDELLQQMAGNTPVNSVPANSSITFNKLASNSIAHPKMNSLPAYLMDFLECKNLINRNDKSYERGRYLKGYNSSTGAPSYAENSGYVVTNFIPVRANQVITISQLQPVGVFYFDINKNKVIDQTLGTSGTVLKNATITVPNNENIAYMKTSFDKAKDVNGIKQDNDEMVVYGNALPSEYQEYGINFKDFKLALDNINQEELFNYISNFAKEPIEAISRLNSYFTQSENLFNKNHSEIEKGKFLTGYNSGSMKESNGYSISHYIPVLPNETYSFFLSTMMGSNHTYVFYDIDKKIVSQTSQNYTLDEETRTMVITVPNDLNIKYIRVNLYDKEFDSVMFVNGDIYPSEYIPFETKISNDIGLNETQKNTVNKLIQSSDIASKSVLESKIITLNGDSICYGAGYRGGYGKIIADRYNMTYENIGIGGGTITAETYSASGSARHWISRTISNMRDDADYIVLEGGVNDAALNVPLGEITSDYTSDLDDTTYCGAFESMLKQAIEKYQGKKIGYILVHKMTKNFDSRYENNHYQMSKKICEKWGIPYLDLNIECPPLNYIPSLKATYTKDNDGWHPNELGYKKYYVDKIVKWLEAL